MSFALSEEFFPNLIFNLHNIQNKGPKFVKLQVSGLRVEIVGFFANIAFHIRVVLPYGR